MRKKQFYSFIGIFLSIALITTVHANDSVKINNILSFLTADLNKDGSLDRIALVQPDNNEDEDAGLYIYLSDGETTQLALHKKNFIWAGASWGTLPSLTTNQSDSLLIHSENSAIGRNRWKQKLTVSYRKKQFIISGYSYTSYDTLDPDNTLNCDVNLLTGKGILNDKAFKIPIKKISLTDWGQANIPKQCQEN
ncbi:MAG: hypothetical protein KAG20_10510 [Cocleimonas sp.]|nr:hypothetical protein [Cocleimonas sp.]